MPELQQWEVEQRAEWLTLFRPFLITEPDSRGEAKAHCPVHEDKNPSANVNLHDGVWNCFSCGRGGPIDNIRPILHKVEETGVVPDWVPPDIELAPADEDGDADPLPSEEDIADWHQDLLDDPAAFEYINFIRGISRAEIRRRRIVVQPDRVSGVKYGFPVYEGDRLVNVRWYAQKTLRSSKRIWSVKGHGKNRLYPVDVLYAGHDSVCIVEGEFDSLILNSLGVPTVTGTVGAGSSARKWKEEWNELFEDKKVYIIPDRDVPGGNYAEYVRRQLKDHALRVSIVKLPYEETPDHGKDVSDFLLEHGGQPEMMIDDLKGLLKRAYRQSIEEEMIRDPDVNRMTSHVRKQDFARKQHRREEIILNWNDPPYTSSLKEEHALPLPPFTHLVEQLHPSGGNTLLSSGYKVGKSTLLLNLFRSLIDGRDFLGQYPVKTPVGKVAFWNYEVSRNQFASWTKSMEINDESKGVVLNLRGHKLALDVEEIFKWARDWLTEHSVKVLIMDPYSRAFAGDENDNSEVGQWLDILDELQREAGVDDLFLSAHYGRGGEERARGAARLEDWADSLWKLNADGEDRYFSADGRDVAVPESKLGFEPVDRTLTIIGESRWKERRNLMADEAVDLVKAEPGHYTFHTLVEGLVGRGTKNERNDAVLMATEEGRISLDRTVSPPRYYPQGR